MTVLEDAERVLGRINAPARADRPSLIEVVGALAHMVEELRAVANGRDEWKARAERAEAKIADAVEIARPNPSVPLGVSVARHYDRLLVDVHRVLTERPSCQECWHPKCPGGSLCC